MTDQTAQMLIQAILPKLAAFLRTEVAPKLKPTDTVTIHDQDLTKIKSAISNTIFQSIDTKLTVNPLFKAISSVTTLSDIDTTYSHISY